ncbi:MAG TPA: VOC family protein [Anaeromyxobacteraceae bacterium]|nr:VOC family protein [Anaeromyxobacteraceae bacterium]
MAERKIIQVGIVVRDLEKYLPNYAKHFHKGPWDIYDFAPPEMTDTTYMGKPAEWSARIALAWVGDRHVEIIQPLKGPNVYYDHLEKHGEGIHHVKEWVQDCKKELTRYRAQGIGVVQSGRLGDDEFYYLDTVPLLGFYLEIGNNGNIRKPDRQFSL